jgi:hypothetical protein
MTRRMPRSSGLNAAPPPDRPPRGYFGIGGDGQRGPDEYADIATVEPYYRVLRDFLISAP